jgi:hypothetical protein
MRSSWRVTMWRAWRWGGRGAAMMVIAGVLLPMTAHARGPRAVASSAGREPVGAGATTTCGVDNVVFSPCYLDAVGGWGRTDTAVVYFKNVSPTYDHAVTPGVICPSSTTLVTSCSLSSYATRTVWPGERDSVLVVYTLSGMGWIYGASARLKVTLTNGIDVDTAVVKVRGTLHDAELEPTLDARAPGLCVADCFEARYTQPLAGYRSLDVARGVTLAYSGATVVPRPILRTRVTARGGTRSTGKLRVTATLNGVGATFLHGDAAFYVSGIPAPGSGSDPDPLVRFGMQLDVSSYGTGLYPLHLLVRDSAFFGGYGMNDTVRTLLPVVNGADSPIAVGWGIAGLQRRYQYTDPGTGRLHVLIVDGDGSYARFEGWTHTWSGGSDTRAEPLVGSADFTVLENNKRLYPDGSWVEFDAAGYMTKFRDGKNGLITVYEYESWTGGQRLKRILDPYRQVSGQPAATVLTYGTYGLASVTAPGAGGPRRSR